MNVGVETMETLSEEQMHLLYVVKLLICGMVKQTVDLDNINMMQDKDLGIN